MHSYIWMQHIFIIYIYNVNLLAQGSNQMKFLQLVQWPRSSLLQSALFVGYQMRMKTLDQ